MERVIAKHKNKEKIKQNVTKQELRDCAISIKPIMVKCKYGERITLSEQKTILEFYFKVVYFIGGLY